MSRLDNFVFFGVQNRFDGILERRAFVINERNLSWLQIGIKRLGCEGHFDGEEVTRNG